MTIVFSTESELQEHVERFLSDGGDVNARLGGWGRGLLHRAARHGYTNIVRNLLDRGADIDLKGRKYGSTALHVAVFNGRSDVVRLLLERGANFEEQNLSGQTPVDLAAWMNKRETLDVFRNWRQGSGAVMGRKSREILRPGVGEGIVKLVGFITRRFVEDLSNRKSNQIIDAALRQVFRKDQQFHGYSGKSIQLLDFSRPLTVKFDPYRHPEFGGLAMPDNQGLANTCVLHSLAKAIVEGYMKDIFHPWVLDFDQACVVSALLQLYKKDSTPKDPEHHFNGKDIELKDRKNNQWNIKMSVKKTTFNDFQQDRMNVKPQYTYILGVSKENAKSIHHSLSGPHCIFVKGYDSILDLFYTVNSGGRNAEFPEIPRSVLQDSDSRSNNSLYKVMCLGTYTRPE